MRHEDEVALNKMGRALYRVGLTWPSVVSMAGMKLLVVYHQDERRIEFIRKLG